MGSPSLMFEKQEVAGPNMEKRSSLRGHPLYTVVLVGNGPPRSA